MFQPLISPLQFLGYGLWLGGPLCVLLLAATMSVGPGRSVSLPGIGTIPESCTLHTQLGIDCPGCGLTRSFIHLAHGRWLAAWNLNPIAHFIFAYVALQVPLALLFLWTAVTTEQSAPAGNSSDVSERPTVGQLNNTRLPAQATVRPILQTKLAEKEPSPRLRDILSRSAQYNQWLLAGLMFALVLRWGVRLFTGGLI